MLSDRPRLRARLKQLEAGSRDRSGKKGRAGPDAWRELEAQTRDSVARRERRAAAFPEVTYPPDLPVSARAREIAELVRENQVVVVCGETGSGKTTQLPKILLELGLGAAGMIGHTQPRRIAARAVSARIAEELRVPLGRQVGSKVRFGDRTSENTLVKVMTDGILLAEMQSDRYLRQYEAIIVDEAHERSLNIDFILGYLKRLLAKRRGLRVVVTSATIDPDRLAEHFTIEGRRAPVLEVSGRTYPVEVRYRPRVDRADDEPDLDHVDAVRHAVDELSREGPGDILVFEPGEREIRDTASALGKHCGPGVEILPLFGRLAHHEQDRVFAAHTGRRIVIATNVAETSLTAPGIRYVIDGGTARINRYSPRTKLQRLEVEPISQASAKQRAGRCGRVAEGICIRLYSQEDHDGRPEFTDPEIRRANLASVILQMKALGLGTIEAFPFVEPPDPRRVRDGLDVLAELGALDEQGALTSTGRELSRLPLDPRLGRMLLEANEQDALAEVLIIVAAMSVQDPRERPFEQRDAADEAHAQFNHPESDFLTLLAIWRFFHAQSEKLGASRLRKACRQNFLSYVRLREWRDTHRQIRLLLAAMGYHGKDKPATDEAIHRSLLVGLLDNVGKKNDEGEYEGPRGARFHLFPGSGLAGKPRWVTSAEIVRTTRVFARTCAKIDPAWVERAAGDQVKRSHSEPRWDAKSGKIVASERVTFRGLELVRDRTVNYGPIDAAKARELFIWHGLVEGELRPAPPFLKQNLELVENLKRLEAKARSSGSIVTEQACFDFYDSLVPGKIYDAARFRKWAKTQEHKTPGFLRMRRRDIVPEGADLPDARAFPDETDVLGVPLRIEYTNDPGAQRDGAAVEVLIHELGQLDAAGEPWLVPGWLEERIRGVLKGLPKTYRRRLDVPTLARLAVREVKPGERSLLDQLRALVRRESGLDIAPEDWTEDRVEPRLRPLVRVVDEKGAAIDEGRDVASLQTRLADQAMEGARSLAGAGYPKRGFTEWSFDDPPEVVQLRRFGRTIDAFPAIVDEGESVSIELRSTQEEAARATRLGVRRLCALDLKRDRSLDLKRDSRTTTLAVFYIAFAPKTALVEELRLAIADRACRLDESLPRTRDAFLDRTEAARARLREVAEGVFELAESILRSWHEASVRLEEEHPPAWAPAIADMQGQLRGLVDRHFLSATPSEWIARLPTFLQGISRRYDKLRSGGLDRDTQRMREAHQVIREYVKRRNALGERAQTHAGLERARWLVEELRISLFAQELRTSTPVSSKRLRDVLAKCQ